jgi:3'-phosphoadenosine 5'-phosphosulfate sulfotransferase (PAPS reductase)/FAD synthetase
MPGSEPVFDMGPVDDAFSRHSKIAFEFSGGKDSTAALYLLRDYWDRMTVYWCAADPLPELREYVHEIAAGLPHFVEVPGALEAAVKAFGLPTDVIPFDCTEAAHQVGAGSGMLLQDRYSCCYRAIMEPAHRAVMESGATLIVRGQKDGDDIKGPLRSGDVADGVELLYPIAGWSDRNVFDYLHLCGIPIPRYYREGMSHSFDCATCTAWLHEPRGAYLAAHYPELFDVYREKLAIVASAAEASVNNLINEIEACRDLSTSTAKETQNG